MTRSAADAAADDLEALAPAQATRPTLDPARRTQLIEAAYLLHAERLVALAIHHTDRAGLDPSWAGDLVHETFLYLHEGNRDDVLCRDPDGLARYLTDVVKKGCRSTARDEARLAARGTHWKTQAVAAQPFAAPESDLATREIMTVLAHIVATSPPQQQQAFQLVRILGHTQAQAAALMGVTPKVVEHSLVRPTLRARRALRHLREGRAR